MNSYSKILEAVRSWKTSEAIKLLEENIREEQANKNFMKGSNEKKQFSIISRLMKENEKSYNTGYRFNKAQEQENGFIFTDGHRAFINSSCLGYEIAQKPEAFNLKPLFDELNQYNKTVAIDINQLKTFIAIRGYKRSQKATMKPFLVQTENGEIIGFNPFYALECIEYSGNNVFKYNNAKSPLYALNNSCLFLPVYVNQSTINYQSWYKEVFGEQELEKAI